MLSPSAARGTLPIKILLEGQQYPIEVSRRGTAADALAALAEQVPLPCGAELRCPQGEGVGLRPAAPLAAAGVAPGTVLAARRCEPLLTGGADGAVRVWNAQTGALVYAFEGHTGPVRAVRRLRDRAFSASDDGTVRQWAAGAWWGGAGRCLRVFAGHEAGVKDVLSDRDGARLFSASEDTTIRVWCAASGEQLRVLRGHDGAVSSLCLSNDERHVYSGSYDTTIRMWSVATGEQVLSFEGHTEMVNTICLTPDGKTLFSGSYDELIILWDARTGERVRELRSHTRVVHCLRPSLCGEYVFSASNDRTVRVWRVSGELLHSLEPHGDGVLSMGASPCGAYVFSGLNNGAVVMWRIMGAPTRPGGRGRRPEVVRTIAAGAAVHSVCT